MTDHITTKTTHAVAGGAATSPWWLPRLEELSTVAGLVLPILGVLWLVLQIGLALWSRFRPEPSVVKPTPKRRKR